MLTTGKALATIGWLAALIALLGAALQHPALLAAAGIVAAAAAAGWGLVKSLQKPSAVPQLSIDEIQAMRAEGWQRCYGDGTPYMRWSGAENAVEASVHRPAQAHTVLEGGKRPVWPSEIGAPE